MATEDIERLKEKIEKDPTSKLFVPLAEEYKKTGMFKEAVDVLIKGLERQPGHLSARVSLGKIYFEQGQLEEAKGEFEQVIAAIPDNLYAHKKLAEIYKDLGDREKALKAFRTVLKLNPMDEWAEKNINEIESGSSVSPEVQMAEVVEEAVPQGESPLKELEEAFEIPITGNTIEAENIPFKPSRVEEIEEEAIPEISVDEELELLKAEPQAFEEQEVESPAEEKPSDSTMSKEDMELWKAHLDAVEDIEELREEPGLSVSAAKTEEGEKPSPAVEEPMEAIASAGMETFETEAPEAVSFEDVLKEPESARELKAVPREPSLKPVARLEDADQFILQGRYLDAMDIYKNLLSSEPDNQHLLQRADELKTLLKLLGKDKEALVLKLDSFLDVIKKRRDEFFRSS